MRKYILLALVFISCGAISTAIAQQIQGMDIDAIQKSAKEQAEDAGQLIDFIKSNPDSYEPQAQTLVDTAHDNIKNIKADIGPNDGPIDLDAMLATAQQNLSPERAAPFFIAFASMSMPDEALETMMRDVTRAGGVVVFRGLPPQNTKAFLGRIAQLTDQTSAQNIAIDPRLFRAFNISHVPVYMALSSGFEPCDSFDCVSTVPPHDRISGNVTAQYALETFANANGPGAPVAAKALRNLGAAR